MEVKIAFERRFFTPRSVDDTLVYLKNLPRHIESNFPGIDTVMEKGPGVFLWRFRELNAYGLSLHLEFLTEVKKESPDGVFELVPAGGDRKRMLSVVWACAEKGDQTEVHFRAHICLDVEVPFFARSIAQSFAKSQLEKLFDEYTSHVETALA
jgi:hypothetical protein